ncbi:Hint domain-containing protein [Ostreiculturibacter nitratireducens]|uniref:Hint domain-containing protein n=1 Tax=Ostreiculturibacter nitratireducens TaxID=3075226 RepID=UPI0031B59F2F
MTESGCGPATPTARLRVFPAEALWVSAGTNLGDPIGGVVTCEKGDIYRFDCEAQPLLLRIGEVGTGSTLPIHAGSETGTPGDAFLITDQLTFVAPDGQRANVLVLRPAWGAEVFALPLCPIAPGEDYRLVEVSAPRPDMRLSDISCASIAPGTRITLPGGTARPIERLKPGDLVLTRDRGAQPLRWIGKATFRARGHFAPVVITAGAFGNSGDLVVSQRHRLLLPQPEGPGIPASNRLVPAGQLVDGVSACLTDGGLVEYFSLVFDRHEIVYAEGIPCESRAITAA